LCRHLFCLMMHVLNYCLFLYFRHNLYKRQNFSNTTTCRCKLCKFGFFQSIFCQYSIIWIQLSFYFFYFIIRWSILGSTFLPKSLCIYNDIKKFIQYIWIDFFELIWNLIFPTFQPNFNHFCPNLIIWLLIWSFDP
jgi:hypothetical protein